MEDLLGLQAQKGEFNTFGPHRAIVQVAYVLAGIDCEAHWDARHISTCSRSESAHGNGFSEGSQGSA